MSFRIVEITLATAVADEGTVTLAYPAGTAQANFTGANASADGAVTLNDNDVFLETASEIDFTYGGSNITLTNDTGVTWPAGSRVRAQLGIAGNDTPALTPGPAVADASGDLAAVTLTVNQILRALRAQGIIKT